MLLKYNNVSEDFEPVQPTASQLGPTGMVAGYLIDGVAYVEVFDCFGPLLERTKKQLQGNLLRQLNIPEKPKFKNKTVNLDGLNSRKAIAEQNEADTNLKKSIQREVVLKKAIEDWKEANKGTANYEERLQAFINTIRQKNR